MERLYEIVDEPRPGALAHLAASPIWPFFAFMFTGPWLSWPWFAFNAFAFGSDRRWRDLLWVLGGSLATLGLALGIGALAAAAGAGQRAIYYLALLPVLWRLGVTYVLFTSQQRGFELYRYFGGKVAQRAWLVVFAGYYLGGRLEGQIPRGSLASVLRWLL